MNNGFEQSGYNILESLNLGSPRKNIKDESTTDNFENDMNILLTKLNEQLENIKQKQSISLNFKPFNLDLDLDNSLDNNINQIKNSNNSIINDINNNNNINNNMIDKSNNNININNDFNNNIDYNKDINNKKLKNESNFNLITNSNNFIQDSNVNISGNNDDNDNKIENNNGLNNKKLKNESNFNIIYNSNVLNGNNNAFNNNLIGINNRNINSDSKCEANNKINMQRIESNKESINEINIIKSLPEEENQISRNDNNNNDNNGENQKYILQASNASNNLNNNLINNNILKNTPIGNLGDNIGNSKTIKNSSYNNNTPEIDNNMNNELDNKNNDIEKNKNIEDDFEIDDIEEIEYETNNNKIINDNKDHGENNIKDKELLNTNINPNPLPNDNYNLNIDEIDLNNSNLKNDNNLSEKEKVNEIDDKKFEKEEINKNENEINNEKLSESEKKEGVNENIRKSENNSLEVDKVSENNSRQENIKSEIEKEKENEEDKKNIERDFDINISEKQDEKKQKKEKNEEEEIDLDIEEIKSITSNNNLTPLEKSNISKNNTLKNTNVKQSNINPKLSNSKENEKINDVEEEDDKKKNENIINNNNKSEKEKKSKNSELKQINTMPQNKSKQLKTSSIKNNIKKSNTTKNASLIRTTITKMVKDEESLPDIADIEDYPILTEFPEDEKALSEIIPDFKEKILRKEKREEIEAREYFLGKNKYLKENAKVGERLSQYMGESDINHTELMKQEYETNGIQNIPNYDIAFEEEIFGEEMLEEIHSPIGGVENLNSFLQKYFLTNKKKIVDASCKFFDKWRRVLGEGNSFYRILLFSLFEAYILNNNAEELKYIIREISSNEFIEIYKEKKIDYNKCFSIFSIILHLLDNKENSKAYEILLKSYLLKDYSFDQLLIAYIKHLIVANIEQLINIYKKKGENLNISELNSYKIEAQNIEPSFAILCIIPYLFNINMNILTIKGNLSDPIQSQINFIDPDEGDLPLISFGYFFSTYYKLYQPNFESIYDCNLNLIENNNKQLTYIFKELKDCKNCEKPTEQIVFLEKKFKICKSCLEEHLSNVCNFRADSFKEDGFIGLEYYTRPIHLGDNYYIDDLEIIELLESLNLLNALCQKYNCNICINCKENNESVEIFGLKCGCTLCQNCIEQLIGNMTNGLKYLSPMEKHEFDGSKCPICKKHFDFEEALKHVKYNNEDMKDSSLRLKRYINTLCFICSRELRREDLTASKYISNDDAKYKKIKIKKNNINERANGIDYMEIEHIICEDCYIKYFKGAKIENFDEENENEQVKYVDLEKGTILCNICCREHNLDPKFLEDGGCCKDCSIF